MRMSRASLDRAQRNDEVSDLSMGIMNNCPLGKTTACREYQPQLPLAGSLSEPCKSRSLMGTTLISCLVACCALQGITMHLQILVPKSLKVCFNNNHIVITIRMSVMVLVSFLLLGNGILSQKQLEGEWVDFVSMHVKLKSLSTPLQVRPFPQLKWVFPYQ